MEIIRHFKNKSGMIPLEIRALIEEAQKITEMLGITSGGNVRSSKMQDSGTMTNLKINEETTHKNCFET